MNDPPNDPPSQSTAYLQINIASFMKLLDDDNGLEDENKVDDVNLLEELGLEDIDSDSNNKKIIDERDAKIEEAIKKLMEKENDQKKYQANVNSALKKKLELCKVELCLAKAKLRQKAVDTPKKETVKHVSTVPKSEDLKEKNFVMRVMYGL